MKREAGRESLRIAREHGELSGELLVRGAVADDIGLIQNMARIVWADTYAGLISEEDQVRVVEQSYSQANLRKSLDQDIFLLAEVSGKAAGYIDMGRQGEVLHLHRLYVMPGFQRLGIGRRLLEEAIALAEVGGAVRFPGNDPDAGWATDQTKDPAGLGSTPRLVVATVERDNHKARSFYRKMGFTEEGSTAVTIQGVELPLIYIVKHLS